MRECAVCGERPVMDGTSSKAVQAQGLDLCNACMDVGKVRRDRAAALGKVVSRRSRRRGKTGASGVNGRNRKLAVVVKIVGFVQGDEELVELLQSWMELRELIRDGLS